MYMLLKSFIGENGKEEELRKPDSHTRILMHTQSKKSKVLRAIDISRSYDISIATTQSVQLQHAFRET